MPDGRIAVADSENHRIRAVTMGGAVTSIAGTGVAGHLDGEDGLSRLDTPLDLAIDATGTVFITDLGNNVVRRLREGVVDTVVGSGAEAWLDATDPSAGGIYGLEGIDYDATRNWLIITDGNRGDGAIAHHRIRGVTMESLE